MTIISKFNQICIRIQMIGATINNINQKRSIGPHHLFRKTLSPSKISFFNTPNVRPNTTMIYNDNNQRATRTSNPTLQRINQTLNQNHPFSSSVRQSTSKIPIDKISSVPKTSFQNPSLINQKVSKGTHISANQSVKTIDEINLDIKKVVNSSKKNTQANLDSMVPTPNIRYDIQTNFQQQAGSAPIKKMMQQYVQDKQFSVYNQYIVQLLKQGKQTKEMIQKLMDDNKKLILQNSQLITKGKNDVTEIQRLNKLLVSLQQRIASIQKNASNFKDEQISAKIQFENLSAEIQSRDQQLLNLRFQNKLMTQKLKELLGQINKVEQKFQIQRLMLIEENQLFRKAAHSEIMRLKQMIQSQQCLKNQDNYKKIYDLNGELVFQKPELLISGVSQVDSLKISDNGQSFLKQKQFSFCLVKGTDSQISNENRFSGQESDIYYSQSNKL